MNIRRGDVFIAALDRVLGRETSKTRPVVVVSNDKNNAYSGTVTILPISSQGLDKTYPFEVFLPAGTANLPKDSKVKADQIRTIDKSRIIKHIGSLKPGEIESMNMPSGSTLESNETLKRGRGYFYVEHCCFFVGGHRR